MSNAYICSSDLILARLNSIVRGGRLIRVFRSSRHGSQVGGDGETSDLVGLKKDQENGIDAVMSCVYQKKLKRQQIPDFDVCKREVICQDCFRDLECGRDLSPRSTCKSMRAK